MTFLPSGSVMAVTFFSILDPTTSLTEFRTVTLNLYSVKGCNPVITVDVGCPDNNTDPI